MENCETKLCPVADVRPLPLPAEPASAANTSENGETAGDRDANLRFSSLGGAEALGDHRVDDGSSRETNCPSPAHRRRSGKIAARLVGQQLGEGEQVAGVTARSTEPTAPSRSNSAVMRTPLCSTTSPGLESSALPPRSTARSTTMDPGRMLSIMALERSFGAERPRDQSRGDDDVLRLHVIGDQRGLLFILVGHFLSVAA